MAIFYFGGGGVCVENSKKEEKREKGRTEGRTIRAFRAEENFESGFMLTK
jgi:hypothetical protein